MNPLNEKLPDPKELEKEIGDFLSKKFGGSVKLAAPISMPQMAPEETASSPKTKPKTIQFDLKPEDLISYLDQYIVKQDNAKAILATKICTHFNRIKHSQSSPENIAELVGGIKSNVLMVGPTGVGKTYMIRLIAKKIGVPFIKGDATKFSETGYVGGDVEDLVRDLVREADGDIEQAQYGIIYIDEIDKIASSRNLVGADVSRTGVQRALLKPMEETDVELKVPHDPVSMIQEIEQFRRTGKREKSTVNTKNILFIMSGAFNDLDKIIKKRITDQGIGFGASISKGADQSEILKKLRSEDLIQFGFESEFVGRLPVRAIFQHLTQEDLLTILENPNNPIILGKKLDFAAYGIDIKFHHEALDKLAKRAFVENTGARGLVSAVESALLAFEKRLPSAAVTHFPVTPGAIDSPNKYLQKLLKSPGSENIRSEFNILATEEKESIKHYLWDNRMELGEKFGMPFSPSRVDIIANYYIRNVMDIERVIRRIKTHYEEIKTLELHFLKNFGINLVLEEDAIDEIIRSFVYSSTSLDDYYKQLIQDFEHGLKLVREKTGRNRFFISKDALKSPEAFIRNLLQQEVKNPNNKPLLES
jgi:endopeptidase Clp ATP-binding regulatory subunit ClpX